MLQSLSHQPPHNALGNIFNVVSPEHWFSQLSPNSPQSGLPGPPGHFRITHEFLRSEFPLSFHVGQNVWFHPPFTVISKCDSALIQQGRVKLNMSPWWSIAFTFLLMSQSPWGPLWRAKSSKFSEVTHLKSYYEQVPGGIELWQASKNLWASTSCKHPKRSCIPLTGTPSKKKKFFFLKEPH